MRWGGGHRQSAGRRAGQDREKGHLPWEQYLRFSQALRRALAGAPGHALRRSGALMRGPTMSSWKEA